MPWSGFKISCEGRRDDVECGRVFNFVGCCACCLHEITNAYLGKAVAKDSVQFEVDMLKPPWHAIEWHLLCSASDISTGVRTSGSQLPRCFSRNNSQSGLDDEDMVEFF